MSYHVIIKHVQVLTATTCNTLVITVIIQGESYKLQQQRSENPTFHPHLIPVLFKLCDLKICAGTRWHEGCPRGDTSSILPLGPIPFQDGPIPYK